MKTKYPANVLSGFEAAAGATFFNLNELQVCCVCLCVCFWSALDSCVAAYALTACSTTGVWSVCQPRVLPMLLSTQDEYKGSPGSVITAGEKSTHQARCVGCATAPSWACVPHDMCRRASTGLPCGPAPCKC